MATHCVFLRAGVVSLAAVLLLAALIPPTEALAQPNQGAEVLPLRDPLRGAPSAYQAACPTPRPPVRLQTQALGDGRLQVTVSAGFGALTVIRFGAMSGSRVVIPSTGQTYGSSSQLVLPAGAASVTFQVVSDTAPPVGSAATPATIPMTVYDGCGDGKPWQTFVGGGTSALQSTATISDAQVAEGDSGTTQMSFTVKLSVPSSNPITLGYATVDGTAKSGQDYLPATGTLTFTPGETLKTIAVQVKGNVSAEPDKTFTVTLSNPVNAVIGQGVATARILNDDRSPSANGDTYAAIAGVALTVGAGSGPPPGLLVNDQAGSQNLQITSFGGLSAGGDVTSNPAGSTVVLSGGGSLKVNADGSFSFTSASGFVGSFTFQYRATSAAGTSDATVTINVGKDTRNHPPTGANKTVTIQEDTAYTFAAADFGFADPGDTPPNGLLAVKIGFVPGIGILANNGVAVTAGTSVSRADIDAGRLTYTPPTNQNGAPLVTLTFQVQDDGGTANGGQDLAASPSTISITVTPVNDPPTAQNKTATALTNVPLTLTGLTVGASDSADQVGGGYTPSFSVASISAVRCDPACTPSDVGAAIVNAAAGTVVIDPPTGFTGTVYLTYTVTDAGNPGPGLTSAPAALTVTVRGNDGTTSATTPVLWFVNNNPGACPAAPCDGRMSHPFTSMADFMTANNGGGVSRPNVNDTVFVYESSTAYSAQVFLLPGQKLVGQDASTSLQSIAGIASLPTGVTQPAMNATPGTSTTLTSPSLYALVPATNNTIRGLTVGNSSLASFVGNAFGTLTLAAGTPDEPADVIVNNQTGLAISLTNGTIHGKLVSTTSKDSHGNGVTLSNVAGDIDFGDTTVTNSADNGVSLTTSSATITFGSLNISPASGKEGLHVLDSTGLLSTARGTITAANAAAVSISESGSSPSPVAISLTAINATGKSAVDLNNVSGSFTVVGDGTGFANGSGGTSTLSDPAGAGAVSLRNVSATVTLNSMHLITSVGGSAVNANLTADVTGILNLTGCILEASSASSSAPTLVSASVDGTAPHQSKLTLNVEHSFFDGPASNGVSVTSKADSQADLTVHQSGFGTDVVTGTPVDRPGTNVTSAPVTALSLSHRDGSTLHVTVTRNTFWGATFGLGAVVLFGQATGAGAEVLGTIDGNQIGKAGVAQSGCSSACPGIWVQGGRAGRFEVVVTDNAIRQVNSNSIQVGGQANPSTNRVKIKGNTIDEPDRIGPAAGAGIQVNMTTDPTSSAVPSMCAEIGDNFGTDATLDNSIAGSFFGSVGIRVSSGNTPLWLPGLTPTSGASATDVRTYLQSANTFADGNMVTVSAGSAGIIGGAACFP